MLLQGEAEMITTPATENQITYATDLQNKIRYHIENITFDRDINRPAFAPSRDRAELVELSQQIRATDDTDTKRALRKQLTATQARLTEEAMDHHLARRAELAATDLSALDKDAMSTWIDEAKNIAR